MMKFVGVVSMLGCFFIVSTPARGGTPFVLEPKQEWVLVGTGAALGIASLAMSSQVDPLTPDEIAALDLNDVNSLDRGAAKPYRETDAGDGLLVGSFLLPLSLLTHSDTRRDWRTLGVMWVETMLLQSGINGVVKAAVLRTRPYVYDPDTPIDKKTAKSARYSFYSGHTATTAANSFFVAGVFHEYVTGRTARVLLWSGAAVYPALTGFLRRDSGHHWWTDVATGYAVGAVIGVLVPRLHLSRGDREVSFGPGLRPGKAGVGLRVTF